MKAQNISFTKLTKREREFSFNSAFALYSEIACSCTGCYLENMIYQIILSVLTDTGKCCRPLIFLVEIAADCSTLIKPVK